MYSVTRGIRTFWLFWAYSRDEVNKLLNEPDEYTVNTLQEMFGIFQHPFNTYNIARHSNIL